MKPTLDEVPDNELPTCVSMLISKMLKEAEQMTDGRFLDSCTAIEVSLKQLVESNLFCTEFELTFNKNELTFRALQVERKAPEAFVGFEGIWKIVFMVCAPKSAPNMEDMLSVRSAKFGHAKYPVVEYKPVSKANNEQKNT